MTASNRALRRAAWGLLGYTVLVILWGAYVRASGAGAGCGSHWPLCNGEIVPRSPGLETLIEYTHRLTSGLLGLLVLAFTVAVYRTFPRGHMARAGAVATVFFIVVESAVGAGLVKFEWVAANDSEARVYVMAFHLVNTLLLVAALTLTAWFAGGGPRLQLGGAAGRWAPLALCAAALLIVGASGAVTALGDTLFLSQGVRPEESPVVARLVASRFYHPTLALLALVSVGWVALRAEELAAPAARRTGRLLVAVFLAQLAIGGVNVLLRAPIAVQILHLAVGNVLWVLFVLVAAHALSSPPPRRSA